MPTRASGCGYGRGLIRTALRTLKTAVVAPIPRASVATAAMVKPGVLRNVRMVNRRSRSNRSIHPMLFIS